MATNDDLMASATERLREATTNHDAVCRTVFDDAGAELSAEGQLARAEAAAMESRAMRRQIEDVAIHVLAEVHHARFVYADVASVIEAAGAEWLYPVVLDRALEAIGGDA